MLTKGEIVTRALKKIRIIGMGIEADAEDLVDSVQELDLMFGAWRNKGVFIPYSDSPTYASPNPNQLSGLDDGDVQAVVLNLAVNLLDFYGKTPTQTLKQQANLAYSSLFSVILPTRDGNPYLPTGSGSSYIYSYCYDYGRFFSTEQSPPTSEDTQLIAIGDTYDYTVSWDDWLQTGASVTAYTIDVSAGLTLVSSQLQENDVYFKVTGAYKGTQTVKIKITSSDEGRVDNRIVYFNVIANKTA